MKKLISVILVLSMIFLYSMNYFEEVKNFMVEEIFNKFTEENTEKNDKVIENFKNIKIGDSEKVIIEKLNKPNRIDKSEYNFSWYVYNSYKEKFIMVGIKDKKVVAMFTNNINSCESEKISINNDSNYIRDNYKTLNYKEKNNIRYEIDSNDEYDIIYKNNKYITVFYDKFDNNRIWAYEIIEKSCEDETSDIYPQKNESIEQSYMYEIIDLINSTRYKNKLNALKYDEKATKSAKKHSEDMEINNFFSHENLKNETPFDRMKKENIKYNTAGENIAAGQTNSIFVHNALMNSYGHRKNILGNYKYIGVGVVFGGKYKTYYTENFFG